MSKRAVGAPTIIQAVLHDLRVPRPSWIENIRKKKGNVFQKAKHESVTHWQLFAWHSHCITIIWIALPYTVLGIVSNLEMI